MKLKQIQYLQNPIFKLTTAQVWNGTRLLIILIIAFHFLFNLEFNKYTVLLIVLLLATPIFTMAIGQYEYFPINYESKEAISFEEDGILTEDRLFKFEEIKCLTFTVNDYKGKQVGRNGTQRMYGPSLLQGVNNVLQLETNSENHTFRFQLSSEEEFHLLAVYICSLYRKGINLKETYDGLKSYGLKHLNYEEIQAFKKKYGA